MLFYECKMGYRFLPKSTIQKELKGKSKRDWGADIFQDINERLTEDSDESRMAVILFRICPEYFSLLVISLSMKPLSTVDMEDFTKSRLVKACQFSEVRLDSLKEILPSQAKKILSDAEYLDYINYRCHLDCMLGAEYHDFSLDYDTNREFKVEEYLLPERTLTERQAMAEAKRMMLHSTFAEELRRIYDKNDPKKFLGHPVHYKLSVNNSETAVEMANLLCHALYSNGRLISRCISRMYDISEGCYNEYAIDNMFRKSDGSTIMIELRGSREDQKNYALCYEEAVHYLASRARKNQRNTLFIFVEINDHPGFAESLICELEESLYLVELREGVGSRAIALRYLKRLAKGNENVSYTEEELSAALGDKTSFRPSDVHTAYETLYRGSLRNKMYTAYRDVSCVKVPILTIAEKDSYQSLQDMVGLKSIKEIVRQILGAAKIGKLRTDMGLHCASANLHMVFTGNPGSAKTTVARLLAEILSNEGILTSGKFVECGRADLVGKYVGWTAPTVEKKFRMARGGILFIDEAYSLVDDTDGCFGDEAINTIVQEMENHRASTIVIFAGYPDKMKKFLQKNEGLRSRIAFHVDFPDYNVDELLDILHLMTKEHGYILDGDAEAKCRGIFAKACKQEEYGNGRFVRNLLEQAILKQSQRLMDTYERKEISKDVISRLLPEDFDVNIAEQYKKESRCLGFAV